MQQKRKPDLIFVLALITGLGVAATEIAHGLSSAPQPTQQTHTVSTDQARQ